MPGHTFETYRNGFGYQQLRAGLPGPTRMAAVGDWWLANHRSLTYAAHRILIAVDTGGTSTASQPTSSSRQRAWP